MCFRTTGQEARDIITKQVGSKCGLVYFLSPGSAKWLYESVSVENTMHSRHWVVCRLCYPWWLQS